ncbi:Ig-like domain repeat protein, partial [Rhodococcus sp. NPDC003348]
MVGTVSAATLATLSVAVVGGVASAASGSVTWDDGASRFTRTISNTTPNAGDVITSSTKFQRTNIVGEYIYTVSDYHPTCLTYVNGSAKMNGSAIGVDTVAADNTKVKGGATQWPVGNLVNGTDRTFEFSYTVGADCARDTALSTWMNYTSGLGSGTYTNKGPTLTVAKSATTTTLAAVTGAKVGQSSQLTATVTGGAAGNTVEFYDGTTKIGQGPLVGNAVSIGWTPTTAGNHSLTAKFLATATAAESQSAAQSVSVGVADVATTTTLQVPATATTGQAVELKATVAPAPSGGTVQFKDGATNIGAPVAVTGGAATLSHTFDAAGGKNITAVFSGAGEFLTSTSAVGSIAVSVPDIATTTSLEVPASATTGQAVELKATVTPADAAGTVQFKDGDANIGAPVAVTGGVATLSHTFDAAGAKNVTAVFSGAAGFLGSTSAVGAVTVTDPDAATSTSLEVPASATTGQSVELKATVSPAPTGGTVQFKDGDTNIGAPVAITGGVATLSHTFDAAGGKSITAVYSGVAGFLTSTSAVSSVTVTDPAPVDVATTTSLEAPGTATTGQSVELKATVSPAPTGGTVQFKDGDTNIGAP